LSNRGTHADTHTHTHTRSISPQKMETYQQSYPKKLSVPRTKTVLNVCIYIYICVCVTHTQSIQDAVSVFLFSPCFHHRWSGQGCDVWLHWVEVRWCALAPGVLQPLPPVVAKRK